MKPLYALAAVSLLSFPGLAQDATPAETPVAAPAVSASEPAPLRTDVPASMAVLVPDDATILLVTRPLAELEDAASSIIAEVDPEMAAAVSVDMLLAQALPPGFDATAIDRTRPLGLAVGPIAMAPDPQPYFLIPTANPDAIKSALPMGGEGFPTRISEGYLGITMGREYGVSTGSSELLTRVPAGLLGLTVDLESILADMRPVIDSTVMLARMQIEAMEGDLDAMGLDQGMDLAALMDAYFDMFNGFLDSVTSMGMSLDLDDSMLDLRVEHGLAEASPMAGLAQGGGTDLSRVLPLIGDESFAMVAAAEWGQLMEDMDPFFALLLGAYPPEMAESLQASIDAAESLYELFGSTVAMGGNFSEDGMRISTYYVAQDQAALLARYDELMMEPYWEAIGMRYVDTKKGVLGEVELTRYTFDFDLEAMLALSGEELGEEELDPIMSLMDVIYGDQLVMTFAQVGDLGVMTLGDDDEFVKAAIERASAAGGAGPADMSRLSGLAARSHPFMSYRLDLGKLLSTILPLVEDSMGAPASGIRMYEGASMPLNFYLGIDPSAWTTGVMIDLVLLAEFAAMMEAISDL